MGRKSKYTRKVLEAAIEGQTSMLGTLRALGLKENGGNYRNIKLRLLSFGLPVPNGQGWLTGATAATHPEYAFLRQGRPDEEVFALNSNVATRDVRVRFLKKTGNATCALCRISDWRGEELTLDLHHKNGNHADNRFNNLCLLCPNCHRQEHVQIKKRKKREKAKYHCVDCKKELSDARPKRCNSCANRVSRLGRTKIDWPSDSRLLEMLSKTSFSGAARLLGVSDNAIRKRLKVKGLL